MNHDRILILDFGSQVTQLIARRVREAHVYCEVHPNDVSEDFIREFAPKGIILSGSYMSAYEESNDQASPAVFSAGVPVLGICYGMQTMATQLGGKVEPGTKREFGYAEVRAHNHTKLLEGIEDFKGPNGEGFLKVWMSHGDRVSELPPGFVVMASTPSCPDRGNGGRNPSLLRRSVPPGSDPHGKGPRDSAALCARYLQLQSGLGNG